MKIGKSKLIDPSRIMTTTPCVGRGHWLFVNGFHKTNVNTYQFPTLVAPKVIYQPIKFVKYV